MGGRQSNLKSGATTTDSVKNSSGDANRSGNDAEGAPQEKNQSEMDTIEDLRSKLSKLEEKNLELTNQHHQDMSRYEKEIMKLRLELERGEALLRILESEMSFAQKEAEKQMDSAEDELHDAKTKLLELHVQRGPRHQPFSYRSENPPDQSYHQDVQQPLAGTDRPIKAICHGTNTGSATSLTSESFCLSFVSEGTTTPRGPSPDESLCVHFGPEAAGSLPLPAPACSCDARTPPAHARGSNECFQPQLACKGAAAPVGPETDDRVRVNIVRQTAQTPPAPAPAPAPCDVSQPCVSPPAAIAPAAPSPAPDAHWGETRYRSCTFSGTDMPSGGTFSTSCPMSGTNTTSESLSSPFRPRGVSTPVGPTPNASWREPRDLHFSSGSETDLNQSYSQHFGPLRAADHPTNDVMCYTSNTDSYGYWRPCPPPLPAFLIPGCGRGMSYNSPGPSGSYIIVMPPVMNTSSELDSSCIGPLSTFPFSIPSCWSRTGTDAGSSFNSSSSFGSRRSYSLPSLTSLLNQNISARTGRNPSWL